MSDEILHLYTYFRSSCSARVRTAALLKGIPLEYSSVHLLKDEQCSAKYTSYNPSASVPTLTVTDKNGVQTIISQSLAILEFLEERYPNKKPLLPPIEDCIGRAHVRELVNIITTDIQPPTNLRILKRVKALGGDAGIWAKDIMTVGLEAYEKVVQRYAGVYSMGDQLTLADIVLAPAVEGALRYQVDLKEFPTIARIYEKIREIDAFRRGDWKHQDDTPVEFRVME